MITFVLIHGTFVQRAEWPALRKTLQNVADESGQTASFEEVQWSGKNSVSGRRSAADRIRTKLLEVRKANPKGPVFVLAHSHGGNALAYFLSASTDLAHTLTGCAFLSTPFVAIRERPNPRAVMASLMFVPALLLTVIAGAYIWHGTLPSEMTTLDKYIRVVLQTIPFGVGIFLYDSVTRETRAKYSLEEAVENQTANIPWANYLYLRYPGDEAALALSTLQFFSLVATKISNLIGRVYGTSSGILETAIQAVKVLVVTAIISASGIISFWHLDVGEPVLLISKVVFWIFFALAFVALVVFFYQAFAAYWFGWTDLRAGFLVELAIEPVPYGGHRLHVLDWTKKSEDLPILQPIAPDRVGHPSQPFGDSDPSQTLDDILRHSWSHTHPDAIKLIGTWVHFCLARNTQ